MPTEDERGRNTSRSRSSVRQDPFADPPREIQFTEHHGGLMEIAPVPNLGRERNGKAILERRLTWGMRSGWELGPGHTNRLVIRSES